MPNDAPSRTTSPARTVILTGASRGIGHATVKRFSAEAWRIITVSREPVPEACKRDPNWSDHITADLADLDGVEFFARRALDILGDDPLHALVNNAGYSPKTPYKERLGCLTTDLGDWRQVFELNFFTPLLLSRRFAAALSRGRGTIINITSIAGHTVHPFAGAAYSTSKAALSALTRELAAELGPLGIRVNALAPGEIETAMLSPEYESLVPRIPMQRLGTPEEVAGVIFQLCGGDFGYVNGAEIYITGGQHLL